MTKKKLQQIYRKKRVLLTDADTKVRIAMTQTKKEMTLANIIYQKIHQLEIMLDSAEKEIKTYDILNDSPSTKRHVGGKISNHLKGMRSLQQETKELTHTLKNIKKKSYRNTKNLDRDFKKIILLRVKMDKHIE